MKNKCIFLIVLLLIAVIGCIDNNEEKTSPTKAVDEQTSSTKAIEEKTNPTKVTIKDQQMLLNGKSFFINGTGYNPVPIGKDPDKGKIDYFTSRYANLYDRDLPLLRKMGANTIRLWSWDNEADHTDFLNKAYNNGKDPIYIIVSFRIKPSDNISDPDLRSRLKSDFRKMVAKNKNNPAILMWAVGNELNAQWRWDKNKMDDLFSLIDEMGKEARLEEGDNYHPVTTTLVDANITGTIQTYDPKMAYLDVWSVQIYRGRSFGSLFEEYKNVSSKPLAILEYGIDSYDNRKHAEYEDRQAEWDTDLWNDMWNNSDVTIGGSVMTYSDGWWKGKMGSTEGCPDNDASFHSECGYEIQGHPDGYANIEHWGIMRVKKNGNGPDIIEPKQVYYAFMKLWENKV